MRNDFDRSRTPIWLGCALLAAILFWGAIFAGLLLRLLFATLAR